MDLEIRNMAHVQALIDDRRLAFARHDFFRLLDGQGSIDQVKRIIPRMAFFVMTFQDVLRLAFERTKGDELRQMTLSHHLEDRGHDLWYLSDVQELGLSLDIAWMYSNEHQLTRDVAYGQIAEVMSAESDSTRLAVTLALEATGAEFFGRVIGFLERVQCGVSLNYFARRHQQIEASHEVFEDESQRRLAQIAVTPEAAREVERAVERTFAGMSELASDLAGHLRADYGRARPESAREAS
jgi:hypothetical protein